MLCRQCSLELPDGSAFCNRCGAAQQAEHRPETSPPAAPVEETLWTGRYSLKAELGAWLLCAGWIGLVAFLFLRFVTARTTTAHGIALALAVGPGLWALGRAFLSKASLSYRLTNHRLFIVRGLLSRQHDELELIRVDDVSVRQSLLQRWLDVGTVTVVSTDASNPRLEIEGISEALALKERIRAQVRTLRGRTTFLETL
jgi:membrane protein YdbS with pleckstrin-like domain